MAGYDRELDKELFAEEASFETTKIKVSVHSYNEGTPKIQISRENLNTDDGSWKWSKLGRVNKEEASKIKDLLGKAIENM